MRKLIMITATQCIRAYTHGNGPNDKSAARHECPAQSHSVFAARKHDDNSQGQQHDQCKDQS